MIRWFGLAVLLVSLGAVALLAHRAGGGLEYSDDMLEEGGKVAGALFVVAVFLERSLAVLNGLWSGDPVRRARAALATDRAAGLMLMAEADLWKERVRLAVGFLFALLISAAGARTLEGLMAAPEAGDQRALFHGVDMVLTAGLLAGGSNGLAQLIELLKAQVQDTLMHFRLAAEADAGRPALLRRTEDGVREGVTREGEAA